MRLSIITVCYNSQNTIPVTILSVLNQTIKPYEYIIIDGDSKDSTVAIVEGFRKDFEDLGVHYLVVSEKDKGIYDAMNKGIQRASGDVVGILNSDDWYEHDTIENIESSFNQCVDVDVVHGCMRRVNANRYSYLRHGNRTNQLKNYMSLNHPTFFVKKNVYDKYGAFSLAYRTASDYEFTLKLYKNGVKFHYVEKVITNMLLGGDSEINYKLGLLEKFEIQKTYNVALVRRLLLYLAYFFKHILINSMNRIGINYQWFIKRRA